MRCYHLEKRFYCARSHPSRDTVEAVCGRSVGALPRYCRVRDMSRDTLSVGHLKEFVICQLANVI
jgi:hypothetical protein